MATKKPKAKPQLKTCTACKRQKPISSRGLCATCYQSAAKQVAAGKASWEELESLGLAAHPNRATGGIFGKLLEEARGSNGNGRK